jgi:site-specific DNA recombinase
MKKTCREGSPDVVAYARVSTVEQAERDLSLTAQLDDIRRYSAQRGFNIVGEFVERGVSGTEDNRPEFQRMIGHVTLSNSRVSKILVLASSRFMRHAAKARLWKEKLRRLGVRVVAIQQETADDPSGRFAEGVFELVDELESETNGIRTRAAMAENARRGYFNGSRPPFGYCVAKVLGPGGEPKNKLEVDADEAELVREVFRRYVSGSGAKAVARMLNRRGLKYRERLWNRDRVLRTLEESAVVGRYFWGRIDSRTRQVRPREDWVAMTVPRIIDDELFALAAEVRQRRDPVKNPGRASSSPLLLSGLARCSHCAQTLQLVTATGGNGTVHRYYQCRFAARAGAEACQGRRVRVDALDNAVLQSVAHELFTPNRCEQILRDYVEAEGGLRKKAAEERRLLEKERNELDRRLAQLYDHLETHPELDDLVADRLRDIKGEAERGCSAPWPPNAGRAGASVPVPTRNHRAVSGRPQECVPGRGRRNSASVSAQAHQRRDRGG